jgi:hypothetical protein
MSLQMLGLLNAHILRICHGNKTVSMMHLHTARERLSGIADLCQVLDAGNVSKVLTEEQHDTLHVMNLLQKYIWHRVSICHTSESSEAEE